MQFYVSNICVIPNFYTVGMNQNDAIYLEKFGHISMIKAE